MLIRSALGAADKRRIQAMLFANNGGDLRQQLLDGAPFLAELTHSLIPTRGSLTPSFTRATTSTWPNNDGYMVTGVAGEIGFVGARRVRNRGAATESLVAGVGGWQLNVNATAVTGVADPNGGTVATTVTATGATGQFYCNIGAISGALNAIVGNIYLNSVYIRRRTGTGTINAITINNTRVDITSSISATWSRVALPPLAATGTSAYIGVELATSGDAIDIAFPQQEDVTAQTTQTAGEYVSVGVPSDWAGDELVTNGTFDTDSDWTKDTGWAISGGVAAYDGSKGSNSTLNTVDTVFVAGQKYVISFDIVAISGNVNFATLAYTSGSYNSTGTKIVEYTHSGADSALYLNALDSGAATVTFDNISVKPAYYHGSFVDGVKCFPTDLSGNPIPSTTLLGYQAQGARTNLCLQSNAFTTTWANSPALSTLSQNVIGPDGAVSAWTCADTDAANTSRLYQLITLTAAAYTASLFVKKTSGATSFPVIALVTGTVYGFATLDTNNGVATAWTANGYGTTLSGVSARCSSFDSDFWRFELTATGTAAAYTYQLYPAGTTNATQSTGVLDQSAQGSAVFYGAQVELGSFASSPIATTTAAVTRNADVLTYSSAGNILGTAGWCYAELRMPTSTGGNAYVIDVGSNRPTMFIDSLGTDSLYDGTHTRLFGTYTFGDQSKICNTWGGASSVGAVDGAVTTYGFDGDMNTGAAISIGCSNASASHVFGTIRNVRIGQRQLSASELGAITA